MINPQEDTKKLLNSNPGIRHYGKARNLIVTAALSIGIMLHIHPAQAHHHHDTPPVSQVVSVEPQYSFNDKKELLREEIMLHDEVKKHPYMSHLSKNITNLPNPKQNDINEMAENMTDEQATEIDKNISDALHKM